MSSELDVILVPPTVSLIELEDGDEWHEIWKSSWTEFLIPQYGQNWRLFLASVIRKGSRLEWIFFREYENLVREVFSHMDSPIDQWDKALLLAQDFAANVTKGVAAGIQDGSIGANAVDMTLYKCGLKEMTVKVSVENN